jgi:peptidoglycan hydrolase CwlO-like protein
MNLYRGKSKIKIFYMSAKAFAILALFLMPGLVFGEVTQQDLINKDRELQAAKDALSGVSAQRRTLQGEVANIDSQVHSIQNDVYVTQSEINRLSGEITTTNQRITQAEAELSKVRSQLSEVVRVMYEEGQISNIELIAKSNNFSDFVNRSEYFEALNIKIKESSDKIVALKNELDSKKTALEAAKKKTEELAPGPRSITSLW